MKLFLNKINTVKPRSFVPSGEVLKKRENLDIKLRGLRPQVQAGLIKMDEITRLESTLEQRAAEIRANQNFVTEAIMTVMKKVDLKPGEYATNCAVCNFSCHSPCGPFNSTDDKKCDAMIGGYCGVCPKKCHHKYHFNADFRYEPVLE